MVQLLNVVECSKVLRFQTARKSRRGFLCAFESRVTQSNPTVTHPVVFFYQQNSQSAMLQKRKKEKKKKTEWSKQPERTPDLSLRGCLLKQRKLQVPAVVQEYCIRSLLPPFLSLYRLQTSLASLLLFKEHFRQNMGTREKMQRLEKSPEVNHSAPRIS